MLNRLESFLDHLTSSCEYRDDISESTDEADQMFDEENDFILKPGEHSPDYLLQEDDQSDSD